MERAWHGRPAGLRTHTLVCISSLLLMLLTVNQKDIDGLISAHAIKSFHPSYHLADEGRLFEYEMTIYTSDSENFRSLAESLKSVERLIEFSITPSGD